MIKYLFADLLALALRDANAVQLPPRQLSQVGAT